MTPAPDIKPMTLKPSPDSANPAGDRRAIRDRFVSAIPTSSNEAIAVNIPLGISNARLTTHCN